MTVDWDRHWTATAKEAMHLARYGKRAATAATPEARLTWALAMSGCMQRLSGRCGSRHVPPEMRAANPQIPWKALARWNLMEAKRNATQGLRNGPETMAFGPMRDFAVRVAPGLAVGIEMLRRWSMEAGVEAEPSGPVLSRRESEESGWTTLAVRVPTARADELVALAERLIAEEPVLDAIEIRRRLAVVSAEIAALGVVEVICYGSTARGSATPASDVDLLYKLTDDRQAWRVWDAFSDVAERVLRKVVDAHHAEQGDPEMPPGAASVWRAE